MKERNEYRYVSKGKNTEPTLSRLHPEEVVSALAVVCHHPELTFLRDVFGVTGWSLYEASSVTEALTSMKRRPVDIVVTDRDLPDGRWRDLLDAFKTMPVPPPLIVTSRLADEYLWAEVLNEGGYDVLAQPFEAEEVIRVISAATRRNHNASIEARRMPILLSAGA